MLEVRTQCRVNAEAIQSKDADGRSPALRARRKDGRLIAPPGAILDPSEMDPTQVERLVANGSLVEIQEPAQPELIAAPTPEPTPAPKRKGERK